MRLRLKTIDDVKRTYQRLIASFATGKLEPEVYKGLLYGLSGYQGLLKVEADLRAAEALALYEESLDAPGARSP